MVKRVLLAGLGLLLLLLFVAACETPLAEEPLAGKASGIADQPANWIAPHDAFLVLDRNGDGLIQAEDVFGERSLVGRDTTNGFEDLALLDGNGDGVVNNGRADYSFRSLQLWKDGNSNQQVDAGEILNFSEGRVAEVRVNYYVVADSLFLSQGTWKSQEAVALEQRLEELLVQLDGQDSGASDIGSIEQQIQDVMKQVEVENNRVSGALQLNGEGLGMVLALDLDGDGLEAQPASSILWTPCTKNCSILPARCGDGIIDSMIDPRIGTGIGEGCDDGNINDFDGCSSLCSLEAGFTCTIPGQSCQLTDPCRGTCRTTQSCVFVAEVPACRQNIGEACVSDEEICVPMIGCSQDICGGVGASCTDDGGCVTNACQEGRCTLASTVAVDNLRNQLTGTPVSQVRQIVREVLSDFLQRVPEASAND